MKKISKANKRRIITAAVLLGLWLLSMGYTTLCCARQLYADWEDLHISLQPTDTHETARLKGFGSRWWSVPRLKIAPFDDMFIDYSGDYSYQGIQAIYYMDEAGAVAVGEGCYAVVGYYTEVFKKDGYDYDHCYMDMNAMPVELKRWLEQTEDDRYVMLDGHFEGEQFTPVKASHAPVVDTYDYDLRNKTWHQMEWTPIVDQSADGQQPLVRIWIRTKEYSADFCSMCLVDTRTDAVTVGDQTYGSLQELAVTFAQDDREYEPGRYEKESLVEAVFVNGAYYPLTRYDAPEEEYGWAVCVTRCYPLRSAMVQLLPIYILTLLAVLLVPWLLGQFQRRVLNKGIENVRSRGKEGATLEEPLENPGWKALYELEKEYAASCQRVHQQQLELRRLETALSYAQEAEINRRKLVSDLTHELKTPLAVIHSYAEGLSEGIAPEKRQKYLDIIMEESEQMDDMVLSMLDLSRLEAGRVRLSQDRVCLMEMTRKVFEKLECLMGEKNLSVHYFGSSFDVTADEGRMEQVITNLATNAIRYTPQDGHIYVTVKPQEGKTFFSMENECQSLSEEELAQIWDSFFKTDSARTSKGTGLGLPIVKAIIELHGGTCRAENTASGVNFQFTLP